MFCSDLRRVLAVALLAMVGLLSACTGDPQSVFQPETPFTNPLLEPGLRGGVNVAPVAGLQGTGPSQSDAEADKPLSETVAETVADALRDAEIAATAAPPVNGRFALIGRADPQASTGGRIGVAWTLVNDHGEEVRRFTTTRPMDPAGGWMKAMASETVAALNRYVMESEGLPPPDAELPKLTIVKVDGAPGAGGVALARSLEYHLKKAGMSVSDKVEDQSALILGKLSLRPVKTPAGVAPRENLTVSWTVKRPDGSELGTIEQANDVIKGTLDGPWGDLAFIIAEGAAEGIVDLLRRTAGRADSGNAGHADSGNKVNALATRTGPSSAHP